MRGLVISIALVAAGCFNPVYTDPACSPAGECPDGFTCVGGVCRSGATIDANPDGPPIDAMIDAPDGAPADANLGTCLVLDQSTCPAGWKCTQVEDNGTPLPEGRCVPDGSIAVGGACTTYDQTLPETGWRHDDCVGGAFCLNGECKSFCMLGGTDCGANYACANYGLVNGSAGVCDPTCDPVTQIRLADDAAACGSVDPLNPTLTCIGQPNGPFFCVNNFAPGNTHGVPAGPPVYLNSCAAGFHPYFPVPGDPNRARCAAFCRPQITYQGNTAGRQGVPGSGYTCPDRGAGSAECRFISWLQDPGEPGFSDYDDVGICFDNQLYNICGPDGTQPCPSCTSLPQSNTMNGCQPL